MPWKISRYGREVNQMVETKRKQNFTDGPIFLRLLVFTLPIIATSLLQVAYNMADSIVVGQFSGDDSALAAVGQTSAYNGFLINLIIGISIGTGVVVAQLFGAERRRELSRAIHTSMTFSVIFGGALCLLGLVLSRPILSIIISADNHALLLDKATIYMMIISAGLPALSVYNFSASVLRSLGDSRSPLIILGVSGLANVGLNLFFVIVCNMSILGVALATIISQYISAVWTTVVLMRQKDADHAFRFRDIMIDGILLKRILISGIPAALQSCAFSVANMILASAIGTLSVASISANTIAQNIDAITYQCMNGFSASVLTFVGQNYGAMKRTRIWKAFIFGIIQVTLVGILVAQLELILSDSIIGLFVAADNPARDVVIAETKSVMRTVLKFYFICGILGVCGSFLRAVGCSTSPMLATVFSVLSVRIIWINFFFPMEPLHNLAGIYYCFPISWVLTILIELVVIFVAARKLRRLDVGAGIPDKISV